jgi:hypothetical protein
MEEGNTFKTQTPGQDSNSTVSFLHLTLKYLQTAQHVPGTEPAGNTKMNQPRPDFKQLHLLVGPGKHDHSLK